MFIEVFCLWLLARPPPLPPLPNPLPREACEQGTKIERATAHRASERRTSRSRGSATEWPSEPNDRLVERTSIWTNEQPSNRTRSDRNIEWSSDRALAHYSGHAIYRHRVKKPLGILGQGRIGPLSARLSDSNRSPSKKEMLLSTQVTWCRSQLLHANIPLYTLGFRCRFATDFDDAIQLSGARHLGQRQFVSPTMNPCAWKGVLIGFQSKQNMGRWVRAPWFLKRLHLGQFRDAVWFTCPNPNIKNFASASCIALLCIVSHSFTLLCLS